MYNNINGAAGIGGTIYSSGGNLTLMHFTNSTAISNGGAIHTANITNSHFANNIVQQSG